MGHVTTKNLFLAYLKSKFTWASCILSGSPTVGSWKDFWGACWGAWIPIFLGFWIMFVWDSFLIKDHPLGELSPNLMKKNSRVSRWTLGPSLARQGEPSAPLSFLLCTILCLLALLFPTFQETSAASALWPLETLLGLWFEQAPVLLLSSSLSPQPTLTSATFREH